MTTKNERDPMHVVSAGAVDAFDAVDAVCDGKLLGPLYDAVMAPAGFQPFIEQFCEAYRLKAVTMIIRHAETQDIKSLWLCGIKEEWVNSYALDYAREDMLAHHIMHSPIGHFYASNLDVPDSDRFAETRFYREWVVPQGVAYASGAIVLQEGAWITQLILQRAPEHPPFTREEMDRLNALVPHLQRAIQMRQRFADLRFGRNFLAGGLDVLAMPTVLFDEYHRVVHYNRSAAAMLEARSDMWLEDGRLQMRDRALTRKLDIEVGNAINVSRNAGPDVNGIVLLPRTGRLPLMLMVAPLEMAGNPQEQGAALLFAFDPEATPSITPELVRRLFGLSEAEASLAVALCCGKTVEDVAAARGTSINTIKSQLKSVFLKTGTKRQSALVSLLLASPAYFLAKKTPDARDHPFG